MPVATFAAYIEFVNSVTPSRMTHIMSRIPKLHMMADVEHDRITRLKMVTDMPDAVEVCERGSWCAGNRGRPVEPDRMLRTMDELVVLRAADPSRRGLQQPSAAQYTAALRKPRDACPICFGARSPNEQYQGMCMRCFVHSNPDNVIVRMYRTKERAVADFVRAEFPDLHWVLDRRIEGGCSRRRPDICVDLGACTMIIEVDENEHMSYDCTCENKRLMELFADAGSRPLIMVRFNPDAYIARGGHTVASCWGTTPKMGLCHVKPGKQAEWAARLAALRDMVALQLECAQQVEGLKEITVTHLFYDETGR